MDTSKVGDVGQNLRGKSESEWEAGSGGEIMVWNNKVSSSQWRYFDFLKLLSEEEKFFPMK